MGASIENGENDATGDGANGSGGYIRQGLNPASGNKYAWMNLARSGENSAQFLANSAKRQVYLKYANVALIGYGGNDFTDSRTPQATLTDMLAIYNTLYDASVKKIGVVRMAPKTNSTDGWLTTANQTIRAGFEAFRGFIDGGMAAASIPIVDVTAGFEQSGMPGIWKANGTTANWSTTDGTHPSAVRHVDAGALLQTAMGSLLS